MIGYWDPEPDSAATRGMVRETAAMDAAHLIAGVTDFLKGESAFRIADEEAFDELWRVDRG